MSESGGWAVARVSGPPAELHGREVPVPASPSITFLEPTSPALVLGRSQRLPGDVGDAADVVRRVSGGGAVWVAPGAQVWVDLVVPRHDRRWVDDDVNRAAWWVGDAWAAALGAMGVADLEVHRGPMACGAWGPAVCFAGLGAGEVTVAGRKAVGVSQRRTRDYALFQCAVHIVWDAAPLVAGLGLPPEAVADLAPAVWSLAEAALDPTRVATEYTAAIQSS